MGGGVGLRQSEDGWIGSKEFKYSNRELEGEGGRIQVEIGPESIVSEYII